MVEMAQHAWTRYWTSRAEHATVGILSGLDDRTLKDIGLDRSEIESVAYSAIRGERRVCWSPAGPAQPAGEPASRRGVPGCC